MVVSDIIAVACLVWTFTVILVCCIGVHQIRQNTIKRPPPSTVDKLPLDQIPHITIIRPVKDDEPYLYECLAATFHQTYPLERLTIFFCVPNRKDTALPILERLLSDFPLFDAKILVEEEDPNLSGRDGKITNLGPNPKIRNMSRAYRETKGDIIWIIDCNVWVSPLVAARMVDLLCGLTTLPSDETSTLAPTPRKYKFVHQLPLVVNVSSLSPAQTTSALSSGPPADPFTILSDALYTSESGGLLEELFFSTSHAKFYTAIATVAIAPCTVGKSNMFRRSHLNALTTTPSASPSAESKAEIRDPGIDFFSDNICEDHLISDLLWRSPVPESIQHIAALEGKPHSSAQNQIPTSTWRNHGLLPPYPSNLATQPMSHMPLSSYIDRRTRWLRVRKFTVTAATLVEPGTESLLCSAYGAWGLTTLPWCHNKLGIPPSWTAFFILFLLSVTCWAAVDRYVWTLLQKHRSPDADMDERPAFSGARGKERRFGKWILAWLGREVLALPIWIWAVCGGVSVVWRGRRFWVGTDMKVHEIGEEVGGNGVVKDRAD
ncbi:Ceramide glucosyltransferase [Lecanora helva]